MYRLLHRIGAGGMGSVYAAHKQAHPQPLPVAVKILRPELAQHEPLVAMFHREAVTSWRINHEHLHLVTVYDFGVTDDGAPYLIMENVDGVRLDYLERDPGPDFRFIRRVVYDILSALEHLHSHDLIHRDVTPRNILVANRGIVKLADLGLIKEQQGSLTGCFAGTPAYASPEALQSRRLTPATDLYSVGAVLYERLTGGKPWGEGRPDDILSAMHENKRRPLPEYVPQDLAQLVDELMARDVDERLQTAVDAIELLDGPMAEDPELAALVARSPRPEPTPHVPDLGYPFRVRAQPPEPALEPGPEVPSHRRGWLTAIVLASVLILGALGAGFVVGRILPTTQSKRVSAPTTSDHAAYTGTEESIPVVPQETAPSNPPQSASESSQPKSASHFEYYSIQP